MLNVTALEFSISTDGGAKKPAPTKTASEKEKSSSKKQGAGKGDGKVDTHASKEKQQGKIPGPDLF